MINIVNNFNKISDKEVYVKYPYKNGVSLRSESVLYLTESIFNYFRYLLKRKDIPIDTDAEPIVAVFAKTAVKFYYATSDSED